MSALIALNDVMVKDHYPPSTKLEDVFGSLSVISSLNVDGLMATMQSEALADAMDHDGALGESLASLLGP